jgi:hypothetical protein
MKDNWFYIKDFTEFVENSRKLVFHCFGQANQEISDTITQSISKMSDDELNELNRTLTYEESCTIVKNHAKKQQNKKTKEIRYCISDNMLNDIIEDLNSRMVSNILNKLVNDNILESAFDSDSNDFVFWIKENLKNDNKNNDGKDQTEAN